MLLGAMQKLAVGKGDMSAINATVALARHIQQAEGDARCVTYEMRIPALRTLQLMSAQSTQV